MNTRAHRPGPAKSVLAALLFAMLGIVGCGGSYGVDDGTIVGTVFGNTFGGSATPVGLEGVRVAAVRADNPALIRTTESNAQGEYVFTNMPVGQWDLGFSKRDFNLVPVMPVGGARDTLTGMNTFSAFVEPGGTARVVDITMARAPSEGDGTVIVTLVDNISGGPVTNATVSVGNATTSNGGTNGVYTLSVPVRIVSGPDGNPVTQNLQTIRATAEGYSAPDSSATSDPASQVLVVANETVTATVPLQPIVSVINGFVQISQFQNLYDLSQIRAFAEGVTVGDGAGSVSQNGRFNVGVPSSNSVLTRQFNLTFQAPHLQTTVVSNVVAPSPNGRRQLTSPVVMQPITVDLVGTVVDSLGAAPNQLNPSGIPDTVVVLETGQVGNIINGTFTIPDVPTVNPLGSPMQLTLQASGYNPLAPTAVGQGAQEVVMQPIAPVSDGSANPTFTVPLLRLQAGA